MSIDIESVVGAIGTPDFEELLLKFLNEAYWDGSFLELDSGKYAQEIDFSEVLSAERSENELEARVNVDYVENTETGCGNITFPKRCSCKVRILIYLEAPYDHEFDVIEDEWHGGDRDYC